MLSSVARRLAVVRKGITMRMFADKTYNGRVVVISSGKGGVGKTTTAASFAMGLAEKGHKVVAIDFDIGLRNLDIHLGCERRVIFDFVNVLQKECTLSQALIKDKRNANLSILAASQTKDKEILTVQGVGELFDELRTQFEYVSCHTFLLCEMGRTVDTAVASHLFQSINLLQPPLFSQPFITFVLLYVFIVILYVILPLVLNLVQDMQCTLQMRRSFAPILNYLLVVIQIK